MEIPYRQSRGESLHPGGTQFPQQQPRDSPHSHPEGKDVGDDLKKGQRTEEGQEEAAAFVVVGKAGLEVLQDLFRGNKMNNEKNHLKAY